MKYAAVYLNVGIVDWWFFASLVVTTPTRYEWQQNQQSSSANHFRFELIIHDYMSRAIVLVTLRVIRVGVQAEGASHKLNWDNRSFCLAFHALLSHQHLQREWNFYHALIIGPFYTCHAIHFTAETHILSIFLCFWNPFFRIARSTSSGYAKTADAESCCAT